VSERDARPQPGAASEYAVALEREARAEPGAASEYAVASEGDARARLFVALLLDADVCAALAAWAQASLGGEPGSGGGRLPGSGGGRLPGSGGGRLPGSGRVRLLDAEALHLTLCFLGSVPLSATDAIGGALDDVVAASVGDPPVLSPAEVRWLPPRRPRVCALALHDHGERAGALQAAVSERLRAGGWYTPERRRWLPHVTVARVARGERAGRVEGPGRSERAGQAEGPGRSERAGQAEGPGRSERGDRVSGSAPPRLGPFPATAVALMRSWPGSRYEPLVRVAL